MGARSTTGVNLVVVASLGLALSGCSVLKEPPSVAPLTDPSVTKTPTSEAPSSPDLRSTPAPELPLGKLPSTCEQLISPSLISGFDQYLTPGTASDAAHWANSFLGPRTLDAIAGADRQLTCFWGIPNSDALASVSVAVLSEQTAADLLSDFRTSVYTDISPEFPKEGVTAFHRGASSDHMHTVTVVFDGTTLVAAGHTIGGDFAPQQWTASGL